MAIPLLAVAAIGAGVQAGAGYLQYRKGVKEAKATDAELKAQQDAYAQTMLPEFRDVEATFKRVSESGMEQAEVNQFMRQASSEQYARQLAAQTMAGGSLARYTLALNNANMLGQIGQLAASNFQRKMMGLSGYERQLGMRQQRTDTDTAFKRQMLMQRGQAAAGLAQAGMANITGAFSSLASGAMSAAGTAEPGAKITDPNYGTEMTSAAMKPVGQAPVAQQTPIGRAFSGLASSSLPIWTDDSGVQVRRGSGITQDEYSPFMPLNTVGPRN